MLLEIYNLFKYIYVLHFFIYVYNLICFKNLNKKNLTKFYFFSIQIFFQNNFLFKLFKFFLKYLKYVILYLYDKTLLSFMHSKDFKISKKFFLVLKNFFLTLTYYVYNIAKFNQIQLNFKKNPAVSFFLYLFIDQTYEHISELFDFNFYFLNNGAHCFISYVDHILFAKVYYYVNVLQLITKLTFLNSFSKKFNWEENDWEEEYDYD